MNTPVIPLFEKSMAPMPKNQLEECLKPFGESRMLPRAAYVDQAVLDWEHKHLFDAGWICAGRFAAVNAPETQTAIKVGNRGVLLVRDEKGELRAFENICRHRGHELLACGSHADNAKIVCPYHAWTYDLDGCLFHARDTENIKNAVNEELGLISIRSAEWGGWVFLNFSGDAPAFADYIGNLDTLAKNWDCKSLVTADSHDYELKANWKVAIENYHECYHCSMIHPALCEVSSPESGGIYTGHKGMYTGGWMTVLDHADTMSFDGKSGAAIFPQLTDAQRREVHYIALCPNFLISLHPDFVMTHRLVPTSPSTTFVECQWLFSPDEVAKQGFDPSYAVKFWDTTNKEDWAAVESVQRGLASEQFIPGILAVGEESVYEFVRLMARAYLQQPLL